MKNSPYCFLLLTAWVTGIYELIPIPHLQEELLGETWPWLVSLIVIILGLLGSVFTIINLRFWRVFVSVTSILFLASWSIDYFLYSSYFSPFELYVSIIKGAYGSQSEISSAFVIYYELLLPLFHLLNTILVIFVSTKNNRGHCEVSLV